MRTSSIVAFLFAAIASSTSLFAAEGWIKPNQKVLFLGDSITHSGGYIVELEARLRTAHPDQEFTLINLGLPSETCCGLSEPAHPFPRPDVHERLDRALAKVKPDVVFACYGMNDGIYHPFSEERFKAYQDGVKRLIAKVKAVDAKLILMTPPPFDPLPLKAKGKLQDADSDKFAWFQIYKNYDEEVLAKYAAFVLSLKEQVDGVIDLHTPINAFVAGKRESEAEFTMSGDGVHLNGAGHVLIADVIWKAMNSKPTKASPAMVSALKKRHQLLHAAWLSHVGHKRPGVKPGLPIAEAQKKAAAIALP